MEDLYLTVIENFCESLRNVCENMDLIKNKINGHLDNKTIRMNIEYQK